MSGHRVVLCRTYVHRLMSGARERVVCVWYTYHVRSLRCRWGGAFDNAHRSILSLALDLIIIHIHAFYISSLAAFAVRALNRRITSPFSLPVPASGSAGGASVGRSLGL